MRRFLFAATALFCSVSSIGQTSIATASAKDSITKGMVSVAGHTISYTSVAGTLTVGSTGEQDALLDGNGMPLSASGAGTQKPDDAQPTAQIFYVAYLKKDPGPNRPITFLFNGGPGSASLWLHVGAFGPRRLVLPPVTEQSSATYRMVNNESSLLDASDLVFIDAPGTGFSQMSGRDKEKAFWGLEPDAHAFERFIHRFLTKYDRWSSPKYLFGESYGTARAAVLSAMLQDDNIEVNGIVLLSPILVFDDNTDEAPFNLGVDQAYALALPSLAAAAFYHHHLPKPHTALEPFLTEVEGYAQGEYLKALFQGSELSETERNAIAERLHEYTGLPTDFILRANLRVSGTSYAKYLFLATGKTIGRIDARYTGDDLDRLSSTPSYDPLLASIAPLFTSGMNEYLRQDLKYGSGQTYKVDASSAANFYWAMPRSHYGEGFSVLPDLATAMTRNPRLKVMVASGYFDLATPYFEAKYEMRHLPIPEEIQHNIILHQYLSGHMVYVNEQALQRLHADIVHFMEQGN